MKHFLVAFFVVLCHFTHVAQAQQSRRRVAATPHPLTIELPNGDTLIVRLHGSEYGHFHTTLDGYLIQEDAKGYYCYVRTKRNGEQQLTKRRAHNQGDRSVCEQRFVRKQAKAMDLQLQQ